MVQPSFFDRDVGNVEPKPPDDRYRRLTVLITVKAAPNPSEQYGETVCVAGMRVDLDHVGWIRLYPINFRDLEYGAKFHKYDVVSVRARPARNDPRHESWRPALNTFNVLHSLKGWPSRRSYLDAHVQESMCSLNRNAQRDPRAQSLALIRPKRVIGFRLSPHGGWTPAEQAKIDRYAAQLSLADDENRLPLKAPRFRGTYAYQCDEEGCQGHKQGFLDWEFVALQLRLANLSDAQLCAALEKQFLEKICAPKNDVAFYVGNQAKRAHVFSVLGVYYPRR